MKCPTECDDDCEAVCHEDHQVDFKKDHSRKECPGYKMSFSEAVENFKVELGKAILGDKYVVLTQERYDYIVSAGQSRRFYKTYTTQKQYVQEVKNRLVQELKEEHQGIKHIRTGDEHHMNNMYTVWAEADLGEQ